MPVASELNIDTTASAMDMANEMFGSGVNIQSASYSGASAASGIYTGGDTTASMLTPSDSGVILSTGNAHSITNGDDGGTDPNVSSSTTTAFGTAGDADLSAIAGGTTYDAAVFEANFIPDGDTLTMQFTFSSEEFLEYVNSGFNDVIGVWVNGVQAELTIGTGDVAIDAINDVSNENLYVDNPNGGEVENTEMDGFTVTLTMKAPVNAGEINTIKIGIADTGDAQYDSNLLIAGESVQTVLIADDDEVTVYGTGPTTIDLLANDSSSSSPTLTITEINGQPVVAGSTVTLATGEVVVLNADGTITVTGDGDIGENAFSYTIEDGSGNSDTAFVTVGTAAPCFTTGTMIDTPSGQVAIEDLEPGDLVNTRDSGPQPLRWIGFSERRAIGADAPIVFEAGALGDHDRIELSPNHRVLLQSVMATLMFGEDEVLAHAKNLVNDKTIYRREDGKPITYVHLLFDQHEIVTGNGMDSESYHPGDQTLDSFDSDTRDEILRFMPSMDAMMGYGFGPTARLSLRGYECDVLMRA